MKNLRRTFIITLAILWFPILVLLCGTIGIWRRVRTSANRAVTFGGCGIINIKGWSDAVRRKGLQSETVVWSTPPIYDRRTFDRDLSQRYGSLTGVFAPIEFLRSVSRSRIVVCGFDGFLLGVTPLQSVEFWLLHLASVKIVACPYGGDAYVYATVHNESLQHALQLSYPAASRNQDRISRRVRRIVRSADFVLPGMMGFDGLGRWDTLAPSFLVIDLSEWEASPTRIESEFLRITHTPNHRGFKGTEFLISAVNRLSTQGHKVSLKLLEKVPNSEVLRVLREETDVLVEQLIHVGYAMSAIEGMATSNVVIANLSDSRIVDPLRRRSTSQHCGTCSGSQPDDHGGSRVLN